MVHAVDAYDAAEARVQDRLAFAAAASGLAGHEVTDPVLRGILEQAARHEITGDQAVAMIRRHVQG